MVEFLLAWMCHPAPWNQRLEEREVCPLEMVWLLEVQAAVALVRLRCPRACAVRRAFALWLNRAWEAGRVQLEAGLR